MQAAKAAGLLQPGHSCKQDLIAVTTAYKWGVMLPFAGTYRRKGRVEGRVSFIPLDILELIPVEQQQDLAHNQANAASPQLRVVHCSEADGTKRSASVHSAAGGRVWDSSSGHMYSWGLGDGCNVKLGKKLAKMGPAERSTEFAALDWAPNRQYVTAVARWDKDGREAEEQAAELLVCMLLWHTQGRELLAVPRWQQLRSALLQAGPPPTAVPAGVAAAAAGPKATAAGPAAAVAAAPKRKGKGPSVTSELKCLANIDLNKHHGHGY
jgi:hypothetical protein